MSCSSGKTFTSASPAISSHKLSCKQPAATRNTLRPCKFRWRRQEVSKARAASGRRKRLFRTPRYVRNTATFQHGPPKKRLLTRSCFPSRAPEPSLPLECFRSLNHSEPISRNAGTRWSETSLYRTNQHVVSQLQQYRASPS